MELIDFLVILKNIPQDYPLITGTFFSSTFILFFTGLNKKGFIAFYAVITASLATPYFIAKHSDKGTEFMLLVALISPIIISFLLMHVLENREVLAKTVYDFLIKKLK